MDVHEFPSFDMGLQPEREQDALLVAEVADDLRHRCGDSLVDWV